MPQTDGSTVRDALHSAAQHQSALLSTALHRSVAAGIFFAALFALCLAYQAYARRPAGQASGGRASSPAVLVVMAAGYLLFFGALWPIIR